MSLVIENPSFTEIKARVALQQRIDRHEAKWLWNNATDNELIELASLAPS